MDARPEYIEGETVTLGRPGVPVWAFLVTVFLLLGAGAGAFGYLYYLQGGEHTPATSRPAAPPPEEAYTAMEDVPPTDKPSFYAKELACAYTNSDEPAPALVEEFDTLIRRGLEQYQRATEMQIRDSTYQVFSLRVYNRPDISLLTALRMIVDWKPSDVTLLSADAGQTRQVVTQGQAPATTTETAGAGVGANVLTVTNMPVSQAVESITKDIVGAYNAVVAAQWEAWYAQQAMAAQQRLDARARQDAIRQAQEEAAAAARVQQRREVLQMEAWKQAGSIMGTYRPR